jgi:hypothetical protein
MSKTSVKSTALEQRVSLAQDGTGPWLMQVLTRYGLLLLCIALVVLFSLLTPSFASMLTLQAILSSKAKIALLALAATIPMIVGKIDLNVGFGIVLWHILAITLQVEYGFSWQMAVLTVLAISALYGLLNGILVALADIDSFVATLGSGTVLYAIALWHSGGRQIVGDLPDAFHRTAPHRDRRHSNRGVLRADRRRGAVAHHRTHPARPLHVRRGRQPGGGAPERHLGQPLHHRRLHRLQRAHRLQRRVDRRRTGRRPGQRRHGLSAAGAGRRLPRQHHHSPRARQRLGYRGRHRHSGYRHRRHSAVRRRILGRAAVQRRDAVAVDHPGRLCPTPPAAQSESGTTQPGDATADNNNQTATHP